MQPIAYLIRKEFRQVFRNRDMLRVIFLVPLVQLFIFSYAANTDLQNVRVSVLDQDQTSHSRRIIEAFRQSDVYVPGAQVERPEDLQRQIRRGRADLTLWIPRGFARDLAAARPAALSVMVDGQHSNLAGRAGGYARALLLRETARIRSAEATADGGGARRGASGHAGSAGIVKQERFFYNPELKSRIYMVPGIVVILITVVSALLTGLAVVREKEIGTLEQIMVSPVTPAQLIAGKTIPFAIIAFGELIFATAVAVLWFDLPLRGSWVLLAAGAAIYLLVTLGIGLLASTLSATQQQAMFTVWFVLVFGILMSGFFYPLESMPIWAQRLTWINPLRFMMNIVRGIFLKGSQFSDLWRDFAVLTAMGTAAFSIAVLRFSKRLA
ncbi:MAG: ABC transporter permease subunit [Candidatus Eisenbacteria bacterium]|nr:ABC transporter permease subunit [Candidatus Eisenbacteria bacterium]